MATVLLTGASGFVGVHTLARLLEEGHRVRALVRDEARLEEHLAPLGLETGDARIETRLGDMTDASSVKEAVAGCDLAVHAAATFSYKRRDEPRMQEQNVRGTRTVLQAARDAACTGIVHVSSTVALARKDAVMDHQSPLGPGVGTYTRSKVESERIARELQDDGAPVTIVNPGGVVGPDDPYLGESNAVLRDILTGRLPTWPRGSLQWVDVRDVAAVVAAALQHPGQRFLVPGDNVAVPHRVLAEVTGRRLPAMVLPLGVVVPAVTPGYLTGWSFLPGALEGARLIAQNSTADASHTEAVLGITSRPVRESFADAVRWMAEVGHISAKQAGRVVSG